MGQALIQDSDRQLKAHVEGKHQTVGAILSRFLNPKDGQVSQRPTAIVDEQGELARLLIKYLGPQNRVLAETLARQLVETTALVKNLSPTDSERLIRRLEGQLREVRNDGHSELIRAPEPLRVPRPARRSRTPP